MRIGCVIPARNEEEYLPKTLPALGSQTINVEPVIVVDDGSTDSTPDISRILGAEVVRGPDHMHTSRTLRVCETMNTGLAQLPADLDYILTIGADDVLPPNWCETLASRMEADSRLVVTSGRVEGDRVNPVLPRGIRLIDRKWWAEEVDPPIRYPEKYGWETYLILYAWWKGYRTLQFGDVQSRAQRTVGKEANWADRGLGMRQNGATLVQVAWRAFQLSTLEGRLHAATRMLGAYLDSDLEPEDWMVTLQGELVRRGIVRRLTRARRQLTVSHDPGR